MTTKIDKESIFSPMELQHCGKLMSEGFRIFEGEESDWGEDSCALFYTPDEYSEGEISVRNNGRVLPG